MERSGDEVKKEKKIKVNSKLGEGTFGSVYSCKSPSTEKEYAVKRNLVERDTFGISTLRELDILNKLRVHPHIVRLEKVAFADIFQDGCFSPLVGKEGRNTQRDDGIHFLFERAVYDLHRFIHGAKEVRFDLIKRYMVHVLLGVEFMHYQRIMHRDLKPSNVLIFGEEKDVFGGTNVAKICDFGLAKPYTYQGANTPNTVTSWYRAPEIAAGYPYYDYKADIWSVGCIFFEMIAKRSYVDGVTDDNDQILAAILRVLPRELPLKRIRELTTLNTWRKVTLPKSAKFRAPKIRPTLAQQIGLQPLGLQEFARRAGSYDAFIDLLGRLLDFEWERRYTATDALNHPFFEEYRPLIGGTRQLFVGGPVLTSDRLGSNLILLPMDIRPCMERKWMSHLATTIFNHRTENRNWYHPRAIFQAIDIFDRYLVGAFKVTVIPPNAIESEYRGYLLDKISTEIRFYVCVYVCIKYFSSIHYPITFESVLAPALRSPEALKAAARFEEELIQSWLGYEIYRPTMYEAADLYGDLLGDMEHRDLIMLASMNNFYAGMSSPELYGYYRAFLKGQPLERLMDPIASVSIPPPTFNLPHHPEIIPTSTFGVTKGGRKSKTLFQPCSLPPAPFGAPQPPRGLF